MLTSAFYGYFDYWNLYHKVTFDGINKLIIVNNGVTQLDVKRDVYSSWKEWVFLEQNSQYERALETVGGEPTVAGQFLDVTYFLVNGWKIKPYSGSYTLNIIGNIFDIDGGQIKVDADINPLFPNNISINTNTSVIVRQVSSGGSGGSGDNTEVLEELDIISGKLDVHTTQLNSQSTALSNQSTALNNQSATLVTINNRLISIESILAQPVLAELIPTQTSILLELQEKINELHKIHGLQSATPLVVNKQTRTAGDITQDININGEEVTVTRT